MKAEVRPHRSLNARPAAVPRRLHPRSLGLALTYLGLSLGALIMFFPVFWMLTTAFKSDAEIFASPIRWWPAQLRWENFAVPMREQPLGLWFFNSLFVASCVTAGNLLLSSLAGYGFAKYRFPGKGLMFAFVLATFTIPIQVTMVPLFFISKSLHLTDTLAGLILPVMVDAFGIFLMRQFISELPDDYLDAARMDGASELRIWWTIVVPLTAPILSALGILTFLTNMDELLWPLINVTSDQLRTLPLGLSTFQNAYQTVYNQLMAVSALAMAPVLLVFLMFQRRIIEGLTLTGLK